MATYDLPTNAGYGTVTGRFLLAYADSNDADVYPDGSPAAGYVIFTPSASYLKDVSASPAPVTIIPTSVTCSIDYDGYLLGPDNTRGVRLVATDDSDLNPLNWTWTVTYRLTDQTGNSITGLSSHGLSLPQGTTVDLTTASPVPSSNGTFYLTGPIGPAGPQGPAGSLSGLTATAPLVYDSGTSNLSFSGTVQATTFTGKSLIVKAFDNTATVTNATGNGTTVTYTAVNSFAAGQTVTIIGLGTLTGSSLNLAGVTIATATGTGFTVTNATVGTSSGIGTATVSWTGTLQEWQNISGTALAAVETNGAFAITPSAAANGYAAYIKSPAAAVKGLIVKAAASPTVSLQEWQNSTGTAVASVSGGGDAFFGTVTATWSLRVNNGIANNVASIIKGAASQTANLEEWQDSTGTMLASITPAGNLNFASGAFKLNLAGSTVLENVAGTTTLRINSQSASSVVETIKAAVSQTADLTQWQNSSGTVLAKIDSSGIVVANNIFHPFLLMGA